MWPDLIFLNQLEMAEHSSLKADGEEIRNMWLFH